MDKITEKEATEKTIKLYEESGNLFDFDAEVV